MMLVYLLSKLTKISRLQRCKNLYSTPRIIFANNVYLGTISVTKETWRVPYINIEFSLKRYTYTIDEPVPIPGVKNVSMYSKSLKQVQLDFEKILDVIE